MKNIYIKFIKFKIYWRGRGGGGGGAKYRKLGRSEGRSDGPE